MEHGLIDVQGQFYTKHSKSSNLRILEFTKTFFIRLGDICVLQNFARLDRLDIKVKSVIHSL